MGCEALDEEDEAEEDPDLAYLKAKAHGSLSNVINEVLKNEKVKKAISHAVVKQSLETGVFLSLLIVGFWNLMNAIKSVLNVTWQGDAVIGVTLIIIGASYVIKKLKPHP